MMDEEQNETGTVADLAVASMGVNDIEGHPFIITPKDWVIQDLERMLEVPRRKKANVTLGDQRSFVDYVMRHQNADHLMIYANAVSPQLVAVLDDHAGGIDSAAWREHRATWTCLLSNEWKTWAGNNGKNNAKGQEAFAHWIEDNAMDITVPEPAEMLEVGRSLQAKKGVSFNQEVTLSDGANTFSYVETVSARAGSKGRLEVPTQFQIAIPVFHGGDHRTLLVRLRYRISDGGLMMWYDLIRPDKVLQDEYDKVVNEIRTSTDATVLFGTP